MQNKITISKINYFNYRMIIISKQQPQLLVNVWNNLQSFKVTELITGNKIILELFQCF